MRLLRTSIIVGLFILQCVASWAVVGVRISDLQNSPTPPNPIKVWGSVTSVSPIKVSDGTTEIQVNGLTAALGDFAVVTGDWDGTVLTASAINYPRRDNYAGEMVSIPAGSFWMGNSGVGDDAMYFYSSELPKHQVTLSAYSIGKYEVTRGEYGQFMNAGGYSNSAYWSSAGWSWKGSRMQPYYWADRICFYHGEGGCNVTTCSYAFTQTDNRPVIGVTYYEAEAFCSWAGGHLPTEAQWERAARWNASTSHANIYPWGDTWNREYCNNLYDNNPPDAGPALYQTAPVGSYSSYPSPSGCQDMAGNVWEWCRDWYGSSYYSTSPPSDPQGPASGSSRVLRGGSWNSYDNNCRCACRLGDLPNVYYRNFGFRLAR